MSSLIPLLLGIISPLIIAWLVYLTLTVTEVDRSQEAVQVKDQHQDKMLEELRSEIINLPIQMRDRYTGSEAVIQNKANEREHDAFKRELDHVHDDLKDHKHSEKDHE